MEREPKPVQGRGGSAPRECDHSIAAVKKRKSAGNGEEDNEESGKRGSPVGKKKGEEPGLSGECSPVKGQRSPSQFRRQEDGKDDDAG
jgi:hypothetical protein